MKKTMPVSETTPLQIMIAANKGDYHAQRLINGAQKAMDRYNKYRVLPLLQAFEAYLEQLRNATIASDIAGEAAAFAGLGEISKKFHPDDRAQFFRYVKDRDVHQNLPYLLRYLAALSSKSKTPASP
jgi:hypothetical protein